jgi:hypothetical protein
MDMTVVQTALGVGSLVKEVVEIGATRTLVAIPGSQFGGSVPMQAGLPGAGGIIGVGRGTVASTNMALTISRYLAYAGLLGKELTKEEAKDLAADANTLAKAAFDPFGGLAEGEIEYADILSNSAQQQYNKLRDLKRDLVSQEVANGCSK